MLKSFAGGRLFGATWGFGDATVLALHGWRRDHRDFAAVFGHGSGPAMAVDLFGFGATPAPPEPWGSADYARGLLPLFADRSGLDERILLVGHSLGGRVALQLATLVPERVERMVLCGVPLVDLDGGRSRPATSFRLVRRLHRLGLVSDSRMEVMRKRHGSPDYRAADGVMRSVLVRLVAEQYREQIRSVNCPVDLVWGELDTEVPREVAVRARPMFARASLHIVPGAGHLVPTEAPDALRRIVFGAGR